MKCVWEKVKIGDVARVRRGASPRPIQKYLADTGMPWVKIADATSSYGRHIERTKQFIRQDGIASSVLVESGTLIVSNSGSPGIPKIMKIRACCHDGWLIFDNYKNIDRDFLYYALLYNKDYICLNANGSVFQNLKIDILKNFKISLPPLKIQKKITSILLALDDKIEKNNKINENLEELGWTIFEENLIKIDYLPLSWKKSNLLEIATFTNGLPMQKFRPYVNNQFLPVLKIRELRQGFCDTDSEHCSNNIDPHFIIDNGDVIFAWSGSLMLDIWAGGICGLNQHLYKVNSNEHEKWLFYFWIRYHLDKFIAIAAAKATTMGHIKKEDLKKAIVFIPDAQVYTHLSYLLKPLLDLIIKNRIENIRLKILRDSLLPRLMSGELDVSELDI